MSGRYGRFVVHIVILECRYSARRKNTSTVTAHNCIMRKVPFSHRFALGGQVVKKQAKQGYFRNGYFFIDELTMDL